jgi:NAD(P)-dependent dehydrogenase (short-subunit alcohol dehydrogenase family)
MTNVSTPDVAAGVDPLFDVRNKRVLITGGSRGLGQMIARGFVERGAVVFITSRKAEECEAAAAELQEFGHCTAIPGDVSSTAGIRGIGEHLRTSGYTLDVLVNNAGATWGAPLETFPEAGWDKTMDVNLKGIFFLIQELLPLLRRAALPQAPARIINITSIDGLRPPSFESFAYSASKAGVIMLTRHLARYLANEAILVNAIAPGFFLTKMTKGILSDPDQAFVASIPLGRLGAAHEIAGVALFLASKASTYLTGSILTCDGGACAAS